MIETAPPALDTKPQGRKSSKTPRLGDRCLYHTGSEDLAAMVAKVFDDDPDLKVNLMVIGPEGATHATVGVRYGTQAGEWRWDR